jgi:hypothetical protein
MAREMGSSGAGSASSGEAASSIQARRLGIFRKEGEYWTVGYGEKLSA